MTSPRFLQIHTIHSYPAALLNRDDSGLAKRLPFGGAVRTRVSSQCLKRHWRTADDESAIGNINPDKRAVRSREIVTKMVMLAAGKANGVSEGTFDAVEAEFQKGVYGEKGEKKDGRQPLLLGLPEVEYLRTKAREICDAHPDDPKEARKVAKALFSNKGEGANFKTFRKNAALPGGIVGALFGRMVTSDPAANIDAAIHVAHAFTVHAEESESDYFSVVDDLREPSEDAGAAHIGDTELTAGVFYGYVVVDVPTLVSNLTGCEPDSWLDADRELASTVTQNLVRLIATVSPGAKLGSTAPYSYAEFMLVEAGSRQPRSLANAFRYPVKAQVGDAVKALTSHLSKLDDAYGPNETRRVLSVDRCDVPHAERLNLDELGLWTAETIRGGEASR